jgi:hypothetical protein
MVLSVLLPPFVTGAVLTTVSLLLLLAVAVPPVPFSTISSRAVIDCWIFFATCNRLALSFTSSVTFAAAAVRLFDLEDADEAVDDFLYVCAGGKEGKWEGKWAGGACSNGVILRPKCCCGTVGVGGTAGKEETGKGNGWHHTVLLVDDDDDDDDDDDEEGGAFDAWSYTPKAKAFNSLQ